MADETDDGWGTSTGLFDDFSGTVVESTFGTDARYNNGETTMLMWKVKPVDMVVKAEDGLIDISFACGDGWYSYDGGETIEHSDNKSKIHSNSKYGLVIDWALGNEDLFNLLKERGGSPLESKIWTGLNFHFTQITKDYKGNIGKKNILLPDEFLGEGEIILDDGEENSDPLSPYSEELSALAMSLDSEEEFTLAAMQLTGITDNAKIVTLIADGGLYTRLKG